MNDEQRLTSREAIRATIRAAGLRSTAPRVAVLEYLQEASTPVTHADIAGILGKEGFDRATIYRNLIDLTDAGLVTRNDHGDHVWRFELRRDAPEHPNEHPHFVCTDCGTVSCLPGASMQVDVVSSKIGRVSEIVIKGQCLGCT